MREILRGPVDLGPGEDADFARLHGDGASNKMLRRHNESYTLCATVLPGTSHGLRLYCPPQRVDLRVLSTDV